MRCLLFLLSCVIATAAQTPVCASKTSAAGTTMDCSYTSAAPVQRPTAPSMKTEQPGADYSSYSVLLVPAQGTGMLMAVDKQQKIVFVPIPAITKAVNEDGISPVRYGEVLQLVRQLADENQRLKIENDHLWKVAENRSGPPTPVIIQQAAAPPQENPEAARQQMRTMLLRNLLAPRSSTVNVNVTDCTRYPALCVGR
jgi:hypothetical protein